MLLRGRKIKRLLEEFAQAGSSKEELRILGELREFQRAALKKAVEEIEQRRFKPEKVELLLEHLA
ncbi:MAG: hypothetical protein V1816_27105, partial [Pseudomonadota bacterium]